MRASLDGSLSTVDEDGTWGTINPNGDIVARSGGQYRLSFQLKTGASSTDYGSWSSQASGSRGDYSTQPKEGVKPTDNASAGLR